MKILKILFENSEQEILKFYAENGIDPDELSSLGGGDFGEAFSIGDGRVLKKTTSKSEFDIAKEIEGKNYPMFAKVYKAEVVGGRMFIILEELELDSDIEDLWYEMSNYLDQEGIPPQYVHMLDPDEMEDPSEELLKFIGEIDDINRGYRMLGIEASDIKPDNLGYDSKGNLKAFDLDDKSR